jgi:hypothetical protein
MGTVQPILVSEVHQISPAQRLEQHNQDSPTLAQQVIARELAGRREGSQALEMMLQAMGTMVQTPRSGASRRWSAAH